MAFAWQIILIFGAFLALAWLIESTTRQKQIISALWIIGAMLFGVFWVLVKIADVLVPNL